MPKDSQFKYDWHKKLSKYNTLRYEDINRELWKLRGMGEFIRNDRFYCSTPPFFIPIVIRKTYMVELE